MNINTHGWRLPRRTFLKGLGVTLALPWLEAMSANAKDITTAGSMAASEIPRRTMFTYWGLGVEIRSFTPTDTGKNYTLSSSLRPLAPFKDDCTVLTDLTSFTGGHGSCSCLLTGVNTVRNAKTLTSVDQQLAAYHGAKTRFPSLVLGTVRETGFGGPFPSTLSWSKNHTPITPENRPEVLFEKLFGNEDNKTLATAKQAMARRASLLDSIKQQAAALQRRVGAADRERLDQYFTSIRDLEERIKVEGEWIDRPKPKVDRPDFGQGSPRDRIAGDGRGYSEYTRLMFDMIALAFQTDSTRVVSHIPRSEGDEAKCYTYLTKSKWDLHSITHHDEEEAKLAMWRQLDVLYLSEWAYFLGKLKSVKEGHGTLLDNTIAAWATTNGGTNAHSQKQLPLILCGGSALGVKHQGHLPQKDVPVANVWQTVVDRVGMPLPDNFQGGVSKGVVKELI
ncbi:MAG TPA: DUF1552 domain-containing protein [Tepidisphaeraceae bacterium]|jgi:hypothetical protein|nr:DUF1552 domain-containing protein [Tepidisphaeraceae bacterium]